MTFACLLNSKMQNFLQPVFDFEALNQSVRDLGVDLEKVPIGFLKLERIQKAYRILSEI